MEMEYKWLDYSVRLFLKKHASYHPLAGIYFDGELFVRDWKDQCRLTDEMLHTAMNGY